VPQHPTHGGARQQSDSQLEYDQAAVSEILPDMQGYGIRFLEITACSVEVQCRSEITTRHKEHDSRHDYAPPFGHVFSNRKAGAMLQAPGH